MEVTITPSSSCYFAGEEFRVTITFTNLAAPSANSRSHRRGHSISSAPLARPPTSPGVFNQKYAPSSPVSATSAPLQSPARRGIVGSPVLPEHPAVTRAKRLTPSMKAQSVSLSPSTVSTLISSTTSPNRNRVTASERPFPTNHPHARKQSVQWSESNPPPSAAPFPVILDAIDESMSPLPPATPPPPSSGITTPTNDAFDMRVPRAFPTIPSDDVASSSRGLIEYVDTIQSKDKGSPRSASLGTLPLQGTESLLWAYAQLLGKVEIDHNSVDHKTFSSIKSKLQRTGPIGGGRMDLHDRTPSNTPPPDAGWGSLFGFTGASRASPRQSAPTSFLSSLLSSRPSLSRVSTHENTNDSPDTISTFTPPQSMLAVDLTLMPGESKTFTYIVRLPPALPPTFRGRIFRFSYHLVIGTCRGRTAGVDSQSRLLRIPLRVYNHVSVDKPKTVYDLLWPSTVRGKEFGSRVEEQAGKQARTSAKTARSPRAIKETVVLEQFGRDLLQRRSINNPNDMDDVVSEANGDSCRLAIEILTRQAKKALYEVHRGGIPVATLTMPKTTFRLGETVHGVISFNCMAGALQVIKITTLLESHERTPEPLRADTKISPLRKVQAEQHDAMTLNLKRSLFALDIPSDASPGFGVSVHGQGGQGGLEWRVRISLLVGNGSAALDTVGVDGDWGGSDAAGDGEGLGNLETVECEVGVVVLPAHTVFASSPVSFPI